MVDENPFVRAAAMRREYERHRAVINDALAIQVAFVGVDHLIELAKGAYVAGRIGVEQFESEVGSLLEAAEPP
jgi:hypothetical protein